MENLLFDNKSIILLSSAVINLSVFFFLSFTRTRTPEKSKKYLALTTLFVALWMFASWINHFTTSPDTVAIFSRLSYVSAIWAIIGFALFGINYNNSNKTSWYIYLFGIITSFFIFFTDKVIKSGIPYNFPNEENVIFGDWFWIFSVFLGILAVFTIWVLINTVIKSNGIKRAKILSIIIFFLISIFVTLIFNLLLPNIGNTDFIFMGQYSTLIFAIGSSWIVIQEKVYSIRYIITNLLAILSTGIILFLISWSVTRIELFFFNWDTNTIFDERVILFGIFTACFVAIFADKLLPFFKNLYFKLFKISIKDIDETIKWFIDSTNRSMNMELYVHDLLNSIKAITNTKGAIIVVPSINKHWSTNNFEQSTSLLNSLNSKTIAIDNLDDENPLPFVAPLISNNKRVAYLCLGQKSNNGYFTLEEIAKLEGLIKIIAITTNRYLLYLRQKKFNILLKEEVKEATAQLEEKNRKLAEKMQFERDMLDILGHELRTPLGIARNAVYLIKDILSKPKPDVGNLIKYNKMAVENIQREVNLLETLLSATKIDNDRLQLTLTEVDLIDVINDSLDGLSAKADEKELKIIFNPPKKASVIADRTRIQEIADNLIDNAIKYTSKGSVTIEIELLKKDGIMLSIIDTGSGIPEKDIPHLGEKFYRVDNYLSSSSNKDLKIIRPGGTGLGLYVTFSLIKSMNGSVKIESKLNQGTTFKVIFPKSK